MPARKPRVAPKPSKTVRPDDTVITLSSADFQDADTRIRKPDITIAEEDTSSPAQVVTASGSRSAGTAAPPSLTTPAALRNVPVRDIPGPVPGSHYMMVPQLPERATPALSKFQTATMTGHPSVDEAMFAFLASPVLTVAAVVGLARIGLQLVRNQPKNAVQSASMFLNAAGGPELDLDCERALRALALAVDRRKMMEDVSAGQRQSMSSLVCFHQATHGEGKTEKLP